MPDNSFEIVTGNSPMSLSGITATFDVRRYPYCVVVEKLGSRLFVIPWENFPGVMESLTNLSRELMRIGSENTVALLSNIPEENTDP